MNRLVYGCIAGLAVLSAGCLIVPNARHRWRAQDPAAFNRTLLGFLADH